MENAPNNLKAEGSAVEQRYFQPVRSLAQGRVSPRHRRLLLALLAGPITREEVDRITGASNGPDEVYRLRRLYRLVLPCTRRPGVDIDGRHVEAGVYSLTEADRSTVLRLIEEAGQ